MSWRRGRAEGGMEGWGRGRAGAPGRARAAAPASRAPAPSIPPPSSPPDQGFPPRVPPPRISDLWRLGWSWSGGRGRRREGRPRRGGAREGAFWPRVGKKFASEAAAAAGARSFIFKAAVGAAVRPAAAGAAERPAAAGGHLAAARARGHPAAAGGHLAAARGRGHPAAAGAHPAAAVVRRAVVLREKVVGLVVPTAAESAQA